MTREFVTLSNAECDVNMRAELGRLTLAAVTEAELRVGKLKPDFARTIKAVDGFECAFEDLKEHCFDSITETPGHDASGFRCSFYDGSGLATITIVSGFGLEVALCSECFTSLMHQLEDDSIMHDGDVSVGLQLAAVNAKGHYREFDYNTHEIVDENGKHVSYLVGQANAKFSTITVLIKWAYRE